MAIGKTRVNVNVRDGEFKRFAENEAELHDYVPCERWCGFQELFKTF